MADAAAGVHKPQSELLRNFCGWGRQQDIKDGA